MKARYIPLASMLLAVILLVAPVSAQTLTAAQIKQIEGIAQAIAAEHNSNSKAMRDNMTASSRAVAIGRTVRIENVLRVKQGLPPATLRQFADETRREVVPQACAANAKNPAFDRGLSYTFLYTNTYGEKLAEFRVNKAICKLQR